MPTIQLQAEHDMLLFPTESGTRLLAYRHEGDDISTIPWPLTCPGTADEELRRQLSEALFDEREVSEHFPEDVVILLPDGEVFAFDPGAMVAAKMRAGAWRVR